MPARSAISCSSGTVFSAELCVLSCCERLTRFFEPRLLTRFFEEEESSLSQYSETQGGSLSFDLLFSVLVSVSSRFFETDRLTEYWFRR